MASRSMASRIAAMDQSSARLGLRIADVLPVPRDPAAGRAQPGTLTTRREQGPALRTNPGIGHRSHATHPTLAGQRAVTPRSGVLAEAARSMGSLGVTHVAME